ncbi:hypothetical protein U1Q18_032845 [Sarracenia purpurea var. burkii]
MSYDSPRDEKVIGNNVQLFQEIGIDSTVRKLLKCHPFHTEGLTFLTITFDLGLALTGSKDSSIHIVNITTGKV